MNNIDITQHYIWIKKYIQKPVRHVSWSFLLEIASHWNLLSISAKISLSDA